MTSYRPDSNSAVTRASVAALPATSVRRTVLPRAEEVRDAFALALGAGEITGRIGDQQHAEFALLTPFGVESCGHEVGGCVTA